MSVSASKGTNGASRATRMTLTPSTTSSTSLVPAATYPAIVGRVLADFRENQSEKMSQADLAEAAGLKQAAWSDEVREKLLFA